MQKQKLDILEVTGIRVLTTKQIAEAYGVTKDKIIYNFNYNKERYILGKHYIEVTGDELRRLKTTCENQMSLKYAKSLYLWTEKGALLHAKSLNTDKAWEVYDYLVDFYFRAKEKEEPLKARQVPLQKTAPKPLVRAVVNIPENLEAQKAILEIKKALGAVDVMLDESNRYLSEESFKRYRYDMADAFTALMTRITCYLEIKPRIIEKQY